MYQNIIRWLNRRTLWKLTFAMEAVQIAWLDVLALSSSVTVKVRGQKILQTFLQ